MIPIFNRRLPLWALTVVSTAVVIVVALVIRNNMAIDDIKTPPEPIRTQLTIPSPGTTPILLARTPARRPTTVVPKPTKQPEEILVPFSQAIETTDPTSNPTVTPTIRATPIPPPRSVVTTISGIRFAISPEQALEKLSDSSTVSPIFRPGERIYTAIQIEGGEPDTTIHRVWYLNGTPIGEGESKVANEREIIQANLGRRWGMPGGNYELVISKGDKLLKSAGFTVNNTEVRITRIAFTREVDAMGLPLENSHIFPATTRKLLVSFQAFNIPNEAVFKVERVINGTLEPIEEFAWPPEFDSGPGAFQIVVLGVTKPDQKVQAGDYRFRIKYDGTELIADTITIGEPDN